VYSVSVAAKTKPRVDDEPTLAWSIVGTLAWFNARGRALSLSDLQKLLLKRQASEDELRSAIKKLGKKVIKKHGLYSLKSTTIRYPTEELKRWYRYQLWRAKLAVGLMRYIPYVRMVALARSVADETATPDSDIDVFIIAKHGRLYLTRILVTGVLQLAGLRRHTTRPNKKPAKRLIANRICLSFYATTHHRDFRSISLKPYDLYMPYWIRGLLPLLDEGTTFEDFQKANAWVTDVLPAAPLRTGQSRRLSKVAKVAEWLLDKTFGVDFERSAAKFQRKRIDANPDNPDPDVNIIVDEDMLKFHEKDRRRAYREEWETLMRDHSYDPALIEQ